VCAAEFARGRQDNPAAEFLLDYADWLSTQLESWTVTTRGELVPGKPRHYIRITPADPKQATTAPSPDEAELDVANGGGKKAARNIVGGDFLHLDQVLKRDLPQGPGWRRYNHDGYGQKADGGAYDGTGEGRCWPILTGERAHYELAAGRDASPLIETMEKFANAGGMLPEQLWDADDLPTSKMVCGGATGSAMPLCWSHAEYISLVRSHRDGVCFDRIEPVYQRYAQAGTVGKIDMWTLAHQPPRIALGKTLRIITDKPATIHWTFDGWATASDLEMREVGCWTGDLPSEKLPAGARIHFTFLWREGWAGKDFLVELFEPEYADKIT
jgi:glucoamylase